MPESQALKGLLHFGRRKTFGGDFSAEVHILDFEGDLYGQTLGLEILKFVRPVQAFKNADALFTQIETDIVGARKYFLRQQVWSQWAQVSMTDKQALAQQAVEHLQANHYYLEAKRVWLYAPQWDREIAFVAELMKSAPEKSYYFPRVEGQALKFFQVDYYADLERGAWGILEPAQQAEAAPEPSVGDLILVPSVAASLAGQRLGQGGGFYDRWLPTVNSDLPRLAILPEFAVFDSVPCERHDQALTQVITCVLAASLGGADELHPQR